MCGTCGCDTDDVRVETTGQSARTHSVDSARTHSVDSARTHSVDSALTHSVDSARTHSVEVEERLLAKNDRQAEHNRRWLADRGITAVNLMSSPGSGKTSLLERTVKEAGADRAVSVVEGDQETLFDSERVRAAGARAVQVNTGSGCHLDAAMVERALLALGPEGDSLVFLENVGNLVCPALFDLGERAKVVIISVTEGDDKPLKYPHMFAAADLVVVNKTDLLPYVDFDVDRCARDARRLNRSVQVLALSVRDGSNIDAWYEWLRSL